jgi:FkbM family methyltransferase
MNKIGFFIESCKLIKNWYNIPFVYYKIIKEKYFIINLRNNLKCKIRIKSTDLQAFANVWLNKEYEEIGFFIESDETVIDIGAHIGLFTVYASQFCKNGKIISCEPIKENFELLKENVSINNLSNIILYNNAITDKNDKVKVYLNNDSAANSIYGNGENYEEISTLSLSKILDENMNEKNCLKLDCEGAEYQIINNTPDKYFKKITKICLEYHVINNDKIQLEKLKKRLNELNYELIEVKTSNKLGLILAKKRKNN